MNSLSKTRIKIFVFLISAGIFTSVGLSVIHAQRNKKIEKVLADNEYYLSLNKDYQKYTQEQLQEIQKLRDENIKFMSEAKLTYNFLLGQQDEILAQHKQQVLTGNVTTGTVTNSGSSGSNSNTSSKTTTKPTSTRRSKTS